MIITSDFVLFLAVSGFGLLAASLAVQKRALWFAAVGMAALTVLTVVESDPVLLLGALALAGARFLRTPPEDSPPDRPDPGLDALEGRRS
ncbi:hypothetical protein DesfrDRAFT_2086 [Solidesulfovibrio fructosivorans JJ]]|uniref:Uncharacterized protein n=1 Tax=Solidesulfovibrio fructosivorans JJ] TaxID=596151 RepID=E1JWT7_SOLFR|nr:hypothetical protein DesfrDRAFT_2086 [Solidesulfovibrio fructosivorans JJ]]